MRVLLDECLPRRLKNQLAEHEVRTVPEAGWAGKTNGELLRAAAGSIDVFVTIDSNLAYQRAVAGLPFGIVILVARSNRLGDLIPLVPEMMAVIRSIAPGEVRRVG
jgi:predicted nuclease of predicted toxin-antitoxin system